MPQANSPATRGAILAETCFVVVFLICSKDATSGALALANSQNPTQRLALHSHTPNEIGQKLNKGWES